MLEECAQKECDSNDESAFINLYEKFMNIGTDEDMCSVNAESNNNNAKGEKVLVQEEINASRPSESTLMSAKIDYQTSCSLASSF